MVPALLHATAIWFAEIARALPVENEAGVIECHVRSLAAWLALREERNYLESFATIVLGGTASAEEKRVAVDRAFAVIRDHAESAHAGATTLSREGRLHVLALRGVDRACRLAGLSSSDEKSALARDMRTQTELVFADLVRRDASSIEHFARKFFVSGVISIHLCLRRNIS